VAIYAITIFYGGVKLRPHGQKLIIGDEGRMATLTILLYHIFAGLLNENNLGLGSQSKDRRMTGAILCLEIVVVKDIVVRDMAVVAIGPCMMRTVAPGSVLRPHNVAIDTGLRTV
jgi:hypothetical protein